MHKYRRTKIGGLSDLVTAVNSSSIVNTSEVVGTPDGTVEIHTYDWQSFLSEHLDKLIGIKSFHHLRFLASNKGHVFAKTRSDAMEVDFNLLKDDWAPSSSDLPRRLTPSGLSPSRQWYLYHKIREYCPHESQDATCPLPLVPEPSTASASGPSTTTSAPSSFTAPLYPLIAPLLGNLLPKGQGVVVSVKEKDTMLILALLRHNCLCVRV